MRRSKAFGEIRRAWARYVLLLAGLGLLVFAVVVGTWPILFDAVAERVLLREYLPSPWSESPAPAAIAGCYDLSFGPWVPKEDLGPDVSFVRTPLKVELTLQQMNGREFAMRAVAGEPGSVDGRGTWRITSKRTLHLVWSTGFSGVAAELGPAGEGLRGRARTFWDFPRSLQMATLIARRSTCAEREGR